MHRKNLPLSECQIKVDRDTGRFSGYASTFGNIDAYGDTIVKGAYEKTLAEDGLPKMFFNHDGWEIPIGKWIDAGEDDVGLRMEGELTLDMTKGRDVYAAMKHGTLDGLSIGYMVHKDGMEMRNDGIRVLKEIKLVEVSVVTHPADSHARIDLTSVKFEALAACKSISDFERFLREAVGCSRGLAVALANQAKALFGPSESGEDAAKVEAMKRTIAAIHAKAAKLVNTQENAI